MKKTNNKSDADTLRQKAEELFKKKLPKTVSSLSEVDTFKLIHELEVHQIELEMQNEELRKAKEHAEEVIVKFAELYDFAPSGYFTFSKEGKIIETNLCGAKMMGKERKQLTNSYFGFFVSDDTRPIFNLFLKKLHNSKAKESCEIRIINNDNLSIDVHLIGIANKNKEQFIVTAINITDRKQAELTIKRNNNFTEALLKSMPIPVYFKDKEGHYLGCNEKFSQLLDVSSKEIKGKTTIDLWPADQSGFFHQKDMEIIANLQNQIYEHKITTRKGKDLDALFTKNVFYDELGQVAGIIGAIQDITERRQADEALKKSEEKYRLMVENTHDIIYTLSIDGVFTYVSPTWTFLLGYSADQVTGNSFQPFVHPDDVANCMAFLQKVKNTKQRQDGVEYRVKHIDGSWRWHTSGGVPLLDKSGEIVGFYGIATDITERKHAEIELLEKEVQYHNLADSSMALIWTSGTDKLCNYFNASWLHFTGRSLEQETGNGWTEGIHPDDFDLCLETYITAFDRQEPFTMEYRLRHVSGEYKWLLDKGTPNFNIKGEFIGYIGFCFDINDRKLAEEKISLYNEELQKLNIEKDKFFSIIAHDLRSPFNSFLGLTQIMAEELPSLTMMEIQNIAVSMQNSATNLFRLLENLLQWARMRQGLIPFNPEILSLASVVDESFEMILETSKNKGIEIIYNIPDNLEVFADKQMLQTIIRNLGSNAVKFTNKGEKIILSAKSTDNNMLEISIMDSGIGMNKDILDNLFRLDKQICRKGTEGEPSTGLGLFLCKDFIEKHNGNIWAESENEKGSIFYFTIPFNRMQTPDITF